MSSASTEIYTLSLHDALPIWPRSPGPAASCASPPATSTSTTSRPARSSGSSPSAAVARPAPTTRPARRSTSCAGRSEEHTSELQSQSNLVCRLLLEKKNNDTDNVTLSFFTHFPNITAELKDRLDLTLAPFHGQILFPTEKFEVDVNL